MKKLLFLISLIISVIILNVISQTIQDVAWRSPVSKVYPSGEYCNLPFAAEQIYYRNPNNTTRIINSGHEKFVLPPDIRPFPHTATQTEVEAANMKGDTNVIYISWNSYGPVWYGCGFAYSGNGGTSWSGSHQTYLPNSGDPGPFVWPAGSSWAGRLGLSSIQGFGYSTNQGTNWIFAMNFPGVNVFDKNLSAVDDVTGSPFFGRAYTVWTNFGGPYMNRIVGSFSTDGGATWSTATPVSPQVSTNPQHIHQGCDIEVGQNGTVVCIWANSIFNGQNSTEDSLGFARSTNGGATWVNATNHALDVNGIRTSNLFNGIRANGFPRLAIDNTGGPRDGWIYVTFAEKNFGPAADAADITLCRSTNEGSSWTHSRINQDTPGNGRYQYFSDIDVAPDGSVVCSYYDQRNTTGFLTEYWMSRSTDGGESWTDVAVSDHSFTPAPIQGLAGGYQGDYTGITCAAGKIWPFWADNSSGIYQIWTAGITIIGINTISNNIPENFFLMQNYPNPFNPSTIIKFAIPEQASVKLTIFDVVGLAMIVPVNKTLNPGLYEINFNGDNYASGIYFYKLEANDFIHVKKMMLIK